MGSIKTLLYTVLTQAIIAQTPLEPSLWGWNFGGANIYDPGIPQPRSPQNTIVYSTCGNNGHVYGQDLGFVCPHMMMYSTDMLLAASYDHLDTEFLYAVCGSSTDLDCGRCYQVQPLDGEFVWDKSLTEKQLILQVVNSGFDVSLGHFDIFMGGGGPGYFTACNKDCDTNFCAGGACAQGLYGGSFQDWNPTLDCYGGGVRPLQNITRPKLSELCRKMSGTSDTYKDHVLWQSCIESNLHLYHQNFLASKALPVQCPEGLTRLTGLRRTDEAELPIPHLQNPLTISCQGSREDHRYCITTMSDCCMPSCAWDYKGSPDKIWGKVDTCKHDGTPYNVPMIPGTTKNISL